MVKGQDSTGQQFEGYRLLRLLGRGSFGKVYLAQHIREHTQVAIKQLLVPVSDKGIWQEFLNEARSIRLQHPHILPLLNFGVSSDEYPYLVMEYAAGGSVRGLAKGGQPLPIEQVARYTLHMASALQYAHDRRLIHRDVKPENMLLRADGTLLLSDFGISLLMDQSSVARAVSLAGTPAYMAPEQGRGFPCPASDQYSLAVVVYEWLSGQRLFNGSAMEVAIQHRLDPPTPLRTHAPELSPQVEQVVMRALAKKPTERFTTVTLFAQALQQALAPDLDRNTISYKSFPENAPLSPLEIEESLAETKRRTNRQNAIVVDPPADTSSLVSEQERSARTSTGESRIRSQKATPPIVPRARSRWRRVLVIASLVLLLVGGGVASAWLTLPHRSNQTGNTLAFNQSTVPRQNAASSQNTMPPQSTASPGSSPTLVPTTTPLSDPTAAATIPATATSPASAPAIPGLPAGWHQAFNDSMTEAQHDSGWMQGSWPHSSCLFASSYYEETTTGSNYCVRGTLDIQNNVFSDLFYQLDVELLKGKEAGLVFRETNNTYYYFAIAADGTVYLGTHSPANGGTDNPLFSGTSSAIRQGQWNTLAVLARGNSITLYINQSQITTVTDTTYTSGIFGVAVNGPDTQGISGDGRFKNATIWTP